MNLPSRRPLIYLITRGNASPDDPDAVNDIVRTAVDNQVDLIQIREKHLSSKQLYKLVRTAADTTRGTSTRLLVNDRADVAAAAGADGVHLAGNSLPAAVIRESFGDGFLIGVSTHTIEEVVSAASDGADFVVFGPIFETLGKNEVRGLDELSDVCTRVTPFPVIALGGIDDAKCASVIAAGASGIAAIRALNDDASIVRICSKLGR